MKWWWKCALVGLVFLIRQGSCLSSELAALQKEYGEWRLQRSPEYATTIGVYKHNDQVENYAYSGFVEEYNKCFGLLTRLKEQVNYNQLDAKERIDYDIFNNTLTMIVEGNNWKDYSALNPVNFLEGPQIDPTYFPKITPFDTVGDYENYIRRLELHPGQIDDMIGRFNKSIEKGHTYHRVSVNKVPGQLEKLLTSYNTTTFPYYKPLLDQLSKLQTITDSKKTEFRERAKSAVEKIIRKLSDLKWYLENVYYNHLRTGFGVSSWDNGAAFYRACLQWHLSLDITPEEVHNKGLQEVERISSEMKKVMAKLNHQGSVKEFFDNIRRNPSFYLQTGEEIVQWYKSAIKNEIEPKLSAYFKDLPNLPIDVEPNPIDGVSGQYIAGPPDGSRPGVFQVNVHRPNQSVKINFMALLLHETLPGHHLQISAASTVKNPNFRKYMTGYLFNVPMEAAFYTSYVEGWGLYAEYLGEEMKLYKTDYDLMGRYGFEIFRACRLVVDTGLHYYNWTREKAIEYMLNYTAFSEEMIAIEIDRYITWPGQACAYKIGELKIKELRKKAEDKLGTKFDIREFHATVLKAGYLPLHILEKNVNQWILETKNKAAETATKCASNGANTYTSWIGLSVIALILFMQ
uniref:DUF885 domain-containing protein n=1 Tax=Magallana gigas TaxID=29159 RepID=A0A8W8IQC3_MAGGI|nr:uncharacterized protein LOC105326099 [Crassostrea gigas]